MKKKIIFPLIFLILSLTVMNQFAAGQAPHIHRQKCIGGTRDEYILYMIKLADGNYLSCGTSESQDADFKKTNHYGGYDAFLMKTDKAGNVLWMQNYGGNRDDIFYNVMETSTGDIIAIGTTDSNNGLVSGNHGAPGTDDVWLVKINKDGKFLKQHCYGGSGSESTLELGMSEGLMMDKDGNILFVGETNSNDGDVSGNHGDYDGWLVKVNPVSFDIIKSKTIGTAAYDAAYNVFEINGDIFVTGSNSKAAYTTTDALTVEVNGDGFATRINGTTFNTIWYKSYGGSGSEYCNASVITKDGNLVLSGHAASSDGDCVGNNGFNTWTWKIDVNNGGIIWKNFTGVSSDTSAAFNLIATRDGGFVAVGAILHTLDPFEADAYAVKIDANGITQWTKQFGGSGNDQILAVVEGNDGGILLTGLTNSNDADVKGYHAGPAGISKYHLVPVGGSKAPLNDAWILELSPH